MRSCYSRKCHRISPLLSSVLTVVGGGIYVFVGNAGRRRARAGDQWTALRYSRYLLMIAIRIGFRINLKTKKFVCLRVEGGKRRWRERERDAFDAECGAESKRTPYAEVVAALVAGAFLAIEIIVLFPQNVGFQRCIHLRGGGTQVFASLSN